VLTKKNEYKEAYKLIDPKLREFAAKLDSNLVVFGGRADSVTTFEMHDDYAEIQFYDHEGAKKIWHSICVMEDKGEYFLTLPCHAVTRHWERRESECCIFVYNPRKPYPRFGLTYPTDLSMRLVDDHCRWLMGILSIDSLPGKIEIYMANSPSEVGLLVGNNDMNEGLAIPWTRSCVCIYPWAVFHEIAHLLMWEKYGVIREPDMLNHGFQEYADGNGGMQKGHLSTYYMKNMLKKKGHLSLEAIEGPPGSTSFTKYLIEEWGRKKYRSLMGLSDSLPGAFKEIYGQSLNDLEQGWNNWLYTNHENENELSTELIEFRIITDTFEKMQAGMFTIYCDSRQTFPSKSEVDRMGEKYVRYCRENNIMPYSNITFYLVNDGNRMKELFRSSGSFYQNGSTMADTLFSLRGVFH